MRSKDTQPKVRLHLYGVGRGTYTDDSPVVVVGKKSINVKLSREESSLLKISGKLRRNTTKATII